MSPQVTHYLFQIMDERQMTMRLNVKGHIETQPCLTNKPATTGLQIRCSPYFANLAESSNYVLICKLDGNAFDLRLIKNIY